MDSTTISLFDNILKGILADTQVRKEERRYESSHSNEVSGRSPNSWVTYFCCNNEHYLLKVVHLPKDSTLVMDRDYIDYAQFQRLTDKKICYVIAVTKFMRLSERVFNVLDFSG